MPLPKKNFIVITYQISKQLIDFLNILIVK